MTKLKERPTAREILEVLNGMWVDTKGIMKIAYCGTAKAYQHLNEIKTLVSNETGKETPRGLVPTEYVIKYFNININYLKKISMN